MFFWTFALTPPPSHPLGLLMNRNLFPSRKQYRDFKCLDEKTKFIVLLTLLGYELCYELTSRESRNLPQRLLMTSCMKTIKTRLSKCNDGVDHPVQFRPLPWYLSLLHTLSFFLFLILYRYKSRSRKKVFAPVANFTLLLLYISDRNSIKTPIKIK